MTLAPKPPICQWCHQEKTLLPDPTDNGEAVFVCTKKVGRHKMPCDGWPPVLKQGSGS